MNKAYSRVIWVNYPATDTPINEANLNRMDSALNIIDDRVIVLDTTKANESDLLTCVASISFNPTTGIMTITQKNGTVGTIDTGLSKLAINFDYDDDPTSPHYQQIIMEMKDGTYKYIDLSALLTQYEFTNSSTIAWTIGNDGTVSASVVNGSITADKLQPNYLADIIVEVGKAQTAATNANADSLEAEGFAIGEQNGVPVTSDSPYYHNNAKYYALQSGGKALSALTDVQISNPTNGQALVYNANIGKWVNGEGGMRIVQIPQPKTVQGQPKKYTYDGTQQTFEWDSIDSAHILLQNENQINAGNYNVIASLKGSGDLWTDMTNAPKSFAWTIAKAQGSFSLSANSASVDVNNPTATINVTNILGDGVISVASDDDNVATASISNGVITITGVGTGTATITVTMADGTNYLGDSHTISVTATYTTQITLVVNGAKGDNIIVTDENGNQTDFSPIAFDANATSKTVTAEIPSNGAEYKFASASFDHWDGTADKAEKVIKLDPQNTTADVMPKQYFLYHGNKYSDFVVSRYRTTYFYNNNFSTKDATVSLTADNSMKVLFSQNGYCGSVHNRNAIDITNFSKMKVQVGNISMSDPSTYLTTYLADMLGEPIQGQFLQYPISNSLYEKDISSDSGNKYLINFWYSNQNTDSYIGLKTIYFESLRSLPAGSTESVTLTIEGAKEDKVTVYDIYGNVVAYIDFATGATSEQVTLAIRTGGERLKFVSSVAKDSNNKNYYKWVDVDDQTTNVFLMPSITFYNYGNECGNTWSFPTISNTAQYLDSTTNSNSTITRQKETNDIYLYGLMQNAGYLIRASAYMNSVIDVTDLTTLHVEYDVTDIPSSFGNDYGNNVNIRMFPTIPNQVQINDTAVVIGNGDMEKTLTESKTLSVDVSDKTGNLYLSISIAVYDTSYANTKLGIKIKRVWAE